MKLNRQQIQAQARKILEAEPGGIRWGELHKRICAETPETPPNTVHGDMQHLFSTSPDIVKMARGTYQLAEFVAADDAVATAEETKVVTSPVKAATPGAEYLTEHDFYASFAEWVEENDEATVAAALGGASLGGKWGTPDGIGVLKPRAQDLQVRATDRDRRDQGCSQPAGSRLRPSRVLPAVLAQELHRRAELNHQ